MTGACYIFRGEKKKVSGKPVKTTEVILTREQWQPSAPRGQTDEPLAVRASLAPLHRRHASPALSTALA